MQVDFRGQVFIKSESSATILLVAANDATAISKARAAYICDGTDDDVQIQEAIDALSDTGGTVELSEGTFNTSALLDITSAKVWLRGQGPQATKINIGTGLQWGINIAANHVTLSDLWIYSVDGDNGSYAAGTHLIGMNQTGLSHLTFDNLFMENCRHAIKFWANTHIKIYDCYFKTIGDQAVGSLGGGKGRPEYIEFRNCTFDGIGGSSITLNPASRVIISDIVIIGDGIKDCGQIDVSSLHHTTRDVVINNVLVINNHLLESTVPTGGASRPENIIVSNCVATGFYIAAAIEGNYGDLLVQNCSFVSPSHFGFHISNCDNLRLDNIHVDVTGFSDEKAHRATLQLLNCPDAQLDNVTVIGSGSDTAACLFIKGADLRVSNSVFKNSFQHGVQVGGGATRSIFIGCRFENNQHNGIMPYESDGLLNGCLFKDNSEDGSGSYSDITLGGGIGGWRVLGCRFEGVNIAYNYDESAPSGDACLVTSNDFDGTPIVSAVREQKTGSIIKNNLGYVD